MPARSFAHLIRSRAIGRLLAVLGTAFVILGITTLPASAHHPIVSATSTCNGAISYTSTAWQTGNPLARANADVRIQAQINGSWVQVGSGAYTPGNQFTFSGTFNEPVGALPFQLRAFAAAKWADGADGGYSQEVTVGAPSGCQSNNPQASVSHTCTSYTASLDNRASSQDVTFSVAVNGATTTKTVAKGDTGLVTGTLHPATDYTITVSGAGKQLSRSVFDTDSCQSATPPTAQITSTCGTYTATVNNPGSSDVGYVVRQSGNPVRSGHIAAGGSATYTSLTLSPGTYPVAVTSGGSTLVSRTVAIAGCQPAGTPTATISVGCTGYDMTLANTGGGATSVPFQVTVNQVTSTVSAGGTAHHVTGSVANGSNAFSVSQAGHVLATKTFDATHCSTTQPPTVAPTAQVSVDCTHGFTTTLNNTASSVPTTFVVTTAAGTGNAAQHNVLVAAGSTSAPTWPVSNGVAQTLTVTAPSMSEVTSSFNGTCAEVSPPGSATPTGTPTATGTATAAASVAAPQATSSASPSATSSSSTSSTSAATTSSSAQVSAPSSLPKTGSSISSLLLVTGVGMLLTGLMMLMLRRVEGTVQG